MVDEARVAATAGEGPGASVGAPGSGPIPSDADRWATFDRWAGWLFVAMALVTGIGGLIVLGAAATLPGSVGGLLCGIAIVEAVLLYGVGAALARRWGWARTAALLLLGIAAVQGVGGALLDLSRSTLTIPVGAILAIVVVASAPGRPPPMSATDRRWAAAIVGLALALVIAPAAAAFLLLDAT